MKYRTMHPTFGSARTYTASKPCPWEVAENPYLWRRGGELGIETAFPYILPITPAIRARPPRAILVGSMTPWIEASQGCNI